MVKRGRGARNVIRGAIYARVSRDPNNASESPDRQISECRKLAAELGVEIVEIYVDRGRSAYSPKAHRPEFERLWGGINDGKVDHVFVWALDRLLRAVSSTAIKFLEDVRDNKVQITTVKERALMGGDSASEFMLHMYLNLAQQESQRKSERIKPAHAQIARDGRWSGGVLPVGYQRVKDPAEPGGFKTGHLELHPVEAPALRDAYEQLLLGHSMASVTRKFNAATGRKPPISPRSLRNVLTSPVTAGRRIHIPEAVDDPWAATKKRRDPTLDIFKASTEAVWKPILTPSESARICEFFNDPTRDRRAGRPPTGSILAGVLKCAVCKESLGYKTQSYQCRNHCTSLSTSKIEEHVLASVTFVISKTKKFPAVPLSRQQRDDVDALVVRRDDVDRRREDLFTLLWARAISVEEAEEEFGRCNRDIEEIEATLAEAKTPSRQGPLPTMDGWLEMVDLATQGDKSASEEQNAAIRKDAKAEVNRVVKQVFERIWVKKLDRPRGGVFDAESRITPDWREGIEAT